MKEDAQDQVVGGAFASGHTGEATPGPETPDPGAGSADSPVEEQEAGAQQTWEPGAAHSSAGDAPGPAATSSDKEDDEDDEEE